MESEVELDGVYAFKHISLCANKQCLWPRKLLHFFLEMVFLHLLTGKQVLCCGEMRVGMGNLWSEISILKKLSDRSCLRALYWCYKKAGWQYRVFSSIRVVNGYWTGRTLFLNKDLPLPLKLKGKLMHFFSQHSNIIYKYAFRHHHVLPKEVCPLNCLQTTLNSSHKRFLKILKGNM